jgi:hypothetical protein
MFVATTSDVPFQNHRPTPHVAARVHVEDVRDEDVAQVQLARAAGQHPGADLIDPDVVDREPAAVLVDLDAGLLVAGERRVSVLASTDALDLEVEDAAVERARSCSSSASRPDGVIAPVSV